MSHGLISHVSWFDQSCLNPFHVNISHQRGRLSVIHLTDLIHLTVLHPSEMALFSTHAPICDEDDINVVNDYDNDSICG